jgi:hypothetical protein
MSKRAITADNQRWDFSQSVDERIKVTRIESTADISAIAYERLASTPELSCTLVERGVFVRELCVQRLVQIHLGTDHPQRANRR